MSILKFNEFIKLNEQYKHRFIEHEPLGKAKESEPTAKGMLGNIAQIIGNVGILISDSLGIISPTMKLTPQSLYRRWQEYNDSLDKSGFFDTKPEESKKRLLMLPEIFVNGEMNTIKNDWNNAVNSLTGGDVAKVVNMLKDELNSSLEPFRKGMAK